MTLKQLDRLIREHGVEAFEQSGREFDPHQHEAVSVQCDLGKSDHSVLEVIQRGYCRGDKVFRPAMVIVNDYSHAG